METILVIPVLLVVLGGVLWLGQLQINRARLLVADRHMAWNLANRHRFRNPSSSGAAGLRSDLQRSGIFAGDWGEIEQEVLTASTNVLQSYGFTHDAEGLVTLKVTTNVLQSYGFTHDAEGLVTLKVTAPKMVSSMFSATSIMNPESGVASELSVPRLHSLTNHFVVARRTNELYVADGGTRFIVPVPGDAYSEGKEELRLDYESVTNEPWSLNMQ